MEKISIILNETKQIFVNQQINFYCRTDQDSSGFIISLILSFICWILSISTKNYSWVDRLWSILPSLYSLHYIFHGKICNKFDFNQRQFLMFSLSVLWGLRLTFNFYRKGGYNIKEEDYRWQIVKKNINNRLLWELFNIFFISIAQNILIFLFSSPISLASASRNLNFYDFILFFLFLFFLIIETIADQQQWNFQQQKKLLINKKILLQRDFKNGFLTNGLFKYSRHPNFFAEITIWWINYLFTINSTGLFINWTIIGAFFLTLLFQASTKLTEDISISKYPDYVDYQNRTSRLILLPPSKEKII